MPADVTRIFHVAVADDWEASLNMGSYEAATRGVPWSIDEPIRAVTAPHLQEMLDTRYQDLRLPLVLIALDADTLRASGTAVDADAESGRVSIRGAVPSADETIVRAVFPLSRVADRWIAPDPTALGG